MSGTDLDGVLEDEQLNAVVGWLVVLALILVTIGLFAVDLVWAGFGVVVVALVVVPPLGFRSGLVMLPWEVILLAGLPLVGIGLGIDTTNSLFTYVAVAAVALIVAVELDAFTTVRMTDGFAVGFVVITTLAMSGLWAVVRWLAQQVLNVAIDLDPESLMIEFCVSAVAGVVAGIVFTLYFRRRRTLPVVPEGVAE